MPPGKIGTVVFDLDGVVHVGHETVPGSGETLHTLRDAGLRILFATNNSSRTPDMVTGHVAAVTGFVAEPDQVVTSALAAAHVAPELMERPLVVGGAGVRQALEAAGMETAEEWRDADGVVVGMDFDITYQRLVAATHVVRRNGGALLATNDDATYPTEDGLWPGAGTLVAALERSTGVTATVAGKPHDPMRRLITAKATGSILMVGDRPETDLALAREDWTTALVLTGVTTDPTTVPEHLRPHAVLGSIAELPDLLGL